MLLLTKAGLPELSGEFYMHYPYCIHFKENVYNDLGCSVMSGYLYMAETIYGDTETLASKKIIVSPSKKAEYKKEYGSINFYETEKIKQKVKTQKKRLENTIGQSSLEMEKNEAESLAAALKISIIIIYKDVENCFDSLYKIKDFPFSISVYKKKTTSGYDYLPLIPAAFVSLLELTIAPTKVKNTEGFFPFGQVYDISKDDIFGNDVTKNTNERNYFHYLFEDSLKTLYKYLRTYIMNEKEDTSIRAKKNEKEIEKNEKYKRELDNYKAGIKDTIFASPIYIALQKCGKFEFDFKKSCQSCHNINVFIPYFKDCNNRNPLCIGCFADRIIATKDRKCLCKNHHSLNVDQLKLLMLVSQCYSIFNKDLNLIKGMNSSNVKTGSSGSNKQIAQTPVIPPPSQISPGPQVASPYIRNNTGGFAPIQFNPVPAYTPPTQIPQANPSISHRPTNVRNVAKI